MGRITCWLLFAVVISVMGAGSASAGWVGSGYSEFLDALSPPGVQAAGSADGTVSFAVYQNTDGDWTNDFGIAFDNAVRGFNGLGGFGAVDASAAFVYFYQIVNTDLVAPEGVLHQFFAPTGGTAPTSFGRVNGFVFSDSAGAVGPSGNVHLGSPVAGAPDREALNGVATKLDAIPGAAFASNGSAVNASELMSQAGAFDLPLGTTNPAIRFAFPNINANGFSSIVFFTSKGSPILNPARLDNAANTFNEVLSPTPVPAGFALLVVGMASIGGLGVCFRRRVFGVAALA